MSSKVCQGMAWHGICICSNCNRLCSSLNGWVCMLQCVCVCVLLFHCIALHCIESHCIASLDLVICWAATSFANSPKTSSFCIINFRTICYSIVMFFSSHSFLIYAVYIIHKISVTSIFFKFLLFGVVVHQVFNFFLLSAILLPVSLSLSILVVSVLYLDFCSLRIYVMCLFYSSKVFQRMFFFVSPSLYFPLMAVVYPFYHNLCLSADV